MRPSPTIIDRRDGARSQRERLAPIDRLHDLRLRRGLEALLRSIDGGPDLRPRHGSAA